jgi:hypothetical protein
MSLVVPKSPATSSLGLCAGDWVEVRNIEEILATPDGRDGLDALPFMPEMLQYCGRRFRVVKSAHKAGDTILTSRNRRMKNAVHLEGLRCDGSGERLRKWKNSDGRRLLSTTTLTGSGCTSSS